MTDPKKEALLKKLDEFRTICVATVAPDGSPDCATVFFARDDEGTLYFSTHDTTLKAANLAKNPRISAATDDHRQSGVQLRGRVERQEGEAAAAAKSRILARHPEVKPFIEKDGVLFFKLVPNACFLINFAWGVDWRIPVALGNQAA